MLVLTSPYICCSCNCLESTALQHHGRCMKSQLQRFISEVKPSRTTRFFPIFPSVNQHGWLNNKSVSADLNSSTKFCDQVQTPSQTDTVVNMARNGTNRSPHIYIYIYIQLKPFFHLQPFNPHGKYKNTYTQP